MVTVKINEDTLLDILIDRVKFWTDSIYVQNIYRDYYERLINDGCFDNCELDIISIVDNDYINNTTTISKEDFEGWNIEDETDSKILAANKDEDLYLIQTY